MNRISTSLTLGTVLAVCALGFACSSGGTDDEDNAGGTANNAAGSGSTAGNGAGGVPGTAGSGSATAGNAPGTAGSGTAGSGTAGSGGGGPGGPSVCDSGTRALPLAEAYVDNFETETRWSGWYGFADTEPASPAIERVEGGAADTGFGAQYAATGIKTPTAMPQGFGAGAGFNLVDSAGGETCLDISAFDGISFWAKGSSGTADIVKFQMIVPATQPADETPKGDCASKMAACAYIHPAKSITLEADWKHYVIPFSEMSSSAAKVTGKVLGFNVITPDAAWDFSIDEVAFYKGEAPMGAVTPAEDTGAGGAAP